LGGQAAGQECPGEKKDGKDGLDGLFHRIG
jgi:hypothetical protein